MTSFNGLQLYSLDLQKIETRSIGLALAPYSTDKLCFAGSQQKKRDKTKYQHNKNAI